MKDKLKRFKDSFDRRSAFHVWTLNKLKEFMKEEEQILSELKKEIEDENKLDIDLRKEINEMDINFKPTKWLKELK